jgi:alkylhydroperoxidase family enzyme
MPLIKTIAPEEAQGTIKEMYDGVKAMAGFVPKPLQLMSASPGLFEVNAGFLKYFGNHPTLNPMLLACIRFAAATHCEHPYCIDLNRKILTSFVGLSDAQVKQLLEDPASVDLPEKDRALLAFVFKAIRTPEDVQQPDVDEVRGHGWTDTDIYDAVAHGTMMVAGGIAFSAFKMGI